MTLYHYSKVLLITLKVFTLLFDLQLLSYNANLAPRRDQPLYKDQRLRPRCGLFEFGGFTVQWNLRIMDKLGHGPLSTIRRLSFIGSFYFFPSDTGSPLLSGHMEL